MHRIKTALAGGVATVAAALLLGCATVPAPVPDAAAKKELAPTGILRVAVFTGNPVIGTSDPAGLVVTAVCTVTEYSAATWMGALLTLRAGNSAWSPQMDLPVDPAGVYTLSLAGSMSQASLQAFLSVLEQNSLARTLVQPTLVALSGQEATFLAGGEIPVPVGQVNGFISIEYKKYGIGVAFVPTVLSGDVVDMRVSVSVSDIDPSSGIQLVGVSVPGLTVREVVSHLRLRSGMTFAMAGLLSEHTVATRSQIPLLGDIPLIGTLFRYVQHDRQETELMIFVTPTLVRPMAAADVPPPPGTTENYNPSDLDLFLLGSLTAGPATRTAQPTGAYGLAR